MRIISSRLPLNKFLKFPWNTIARSGSSTGGSTTKIPVPKDKGEIYDEKSDMIQIVEMDDLPRAQKRFAKQFEKVNDERLKEVFAKSYKNLIGFTILISCVVGIYWYTIHAVKQETFLEEIDQEVAIEKGEVPPVIHK
uniref:Cytochrome c oxidase assembly factor 3 n=1 Tax=Panagrolaimus superbus TaxID=310955 RepID=A0A914YC52_9BILA